ncbi:MarR family transcriptional regulator [Ensifer sp. 2YAB10]|jgi:DNA-binding MarR family transcriptional regulator|uniref:MarR family winged helix-turn-helix transcriptional regulator n=1 Tax=Ensifer TaxID=106591 RepID=UPI000DE2BF70|nr:MULTISPECIES: MarR family transcriptional regulator [Ensifer]MBK5565937.1 MarR family transcriptional regulator [Ensifer sp. SSB1]MBZ7923313.1 MarR family transcriptional regulator [Ensifer adhaerens]UAX91887.1 MarR family transcriptional regulator [Ensifer adhaerens]UAX99515.1 MarR family transcriptional regulator [Ensifer adhaerens]UAY06898.1 MarR family transcriptional regulator [Ensifer adhaerens]
MGKKSKAEKKGKNGKKKDEILIEPHDLPAILVQAARSMRTVLSRNLLESGLYAGQDGVMLALAETDGMTAGGLAARLGVKAPTMTRTIGRMEAQGFLERRPDEDDARLTKVYLTEPGRNRLQTIAEAGQHSEKLATRGLTDKQVRTLMKLLRAVDSNLQAARAAD